MCPNCRAFVSITDRVCPYCEMHLGPRAIDMRAPAFVASFLPRANLTSIIVLVINIACYIFEKNFHYPLVEFLGRASNADVVGHGQWWRLITAGFLHANFSHIAMNSWSLFILVTEVEQFYGTSRLLVAYVVSTITGFLFACLFSPAPVLGASCAAFGLMGTMLAMGLGRRSDPLALAVREHYGQWVIFGLIMSFFGNISLLGHLGGFVGGLAVGWIAGRPGVPGSPREQFWQIAGAAAVALVLLAFARNFAYISQYLRLLQHGNM